MQLHTQRGRGAGSQEQWQAGGDAAADAFCIPKSNQALGEMHLTRGGVRQVSRFSEIMTPVCFQRILQRRGETAPNPDVPPVQR